MSKSIVFPFLVARQDRASALWSFSPEASALGTADAWDVTTDVSAGVALRVDLHGLREDCGFSAGTHIGASLCWRSRGTSLRGRLAHSRMSLLAPSDEVALSGTIPGHLLAHDVEFSILLHVDRKIRGDSGLSASQPGELVWKDSRRLVIEGEAARFPVEARTFSGSSWPSAAPWVLDWSPAMLDAPLLGNVRLVINSEHPAADEILATGESSRLWRDFMRLDIAGQLIRGGIGDDEFVDQPGSYPEGSIGAHIYHLIRHYLPSFSAHTLRAMAQDSPGLFSAELAGAFKVSKS